MRVARRSTQSVGNLVDFVQTIIAFSFAPMFPNRQWWQWFEQKKAMKDENEITSNEDFRDILPVSMWYNVYTIQCTRWLFAADRRRRRYGSPRNQKADVRAISVQCYSSSKATCFRESTRMRTVVEKSRPWWWAQLASKTNFFFYF